MVATGGDYQVTNDRRVQQFLSFPNVCYSRADRSKVVTRLCATHKGVERVLAIEARAANIERAKFIGSLLGVSSVQFKQANLEQLQLVGLGHFDAIFCCGLLYHLPEPWKLISQAPLVAPSLYIWTVYANENEAKIEIDRIRGREYVEGGLDGHSVDYRPKSIWLTLPSLLELLKERGYRNIEVSETAKPNGPCHEVWLLPPN
jgi:hypothetical protein